MSTKTNPCLDSANMDRKAHSDKYAVTVEGDSMTIQVDPGEYDLNVMMKRFGITGQMPENPRPILYGDFTQVMDFRTAVAATQAAWDKFNELTPEVRAYFQNDPQRLLEAHAQLETSPEMRKRFKDMGLFKEPPAEPKPMLVQVVPEVKTT